MKISSPVLYRKTYDQVVEDLDEDLKRSVPGWIGIENGPGWAMVRLFSRLFDLSVQRLNQVPDKHFLAFLNAACIDFTPSVPAVTELSFVLDKDAPDAVVIPGGSQMATVRTESDEEIVFETTRDVTLSKVSLVRVLSFDRQHASDHTDEASGLKSGSWPAFQGFIERKRSFFLGEPLLFSFSDEIHRAGSTITLSFEFEKPGQPEKEGWKINWFYFNGSSLCILPEKSIEDNTENFSRSGNVILKNLPCLMEKECGSCLFLTLEGGNDRDVLPVIKSVSGTRKFSLDSAPAVSAELFAAMQNGTVYAPVDRSGEFFPFGQKPSRLDALYIKDDQVFAKAGGSCTISMTVTHAPDQAENPDAVIIWEYYGEEGWSAVSVSSDSTGHFRKQGAFSIVFKIPVMSRVKVNGVEGLWIRARVRSGSYEKTGGVTKQGDAVKWNPPVLSAPILNRFKMNLSFNEVSEGPLVLTRAVSCIDEMIVDLSDAVSGSESFSPFGAVDESPALYLGFDRAFPQEKWIQIRVDVDEDAMAEAYDIPVLYEYFNGTEFVEMGVSDGTLGFKTRGSLGFFSPPDHEIKEVYGISAYWIRIRPEIQGGPGPFLKTVATNSVQAVNSETFHDVVLGSSDGKKEQIFRLPFSSVAEGIVLAVLEHDRPGKAELEILGTESTDPVFPYESDKWIRWTQVPDFYSSTHSSRHYVIDHANGTVLFGDGERGAVPHIGKNNIRLVKVSRHDGAKGNVRAGSITVVRNPAGVLSSIKKVTNRETASGGTDFETLDSIKKRGPQRLKHRGRAVTPEDFEWLAKEVSGDIRNAKCFPSTDSSGKSRAGHVTVVITPESFEKKPVPGPGLKRKIKEALESHALANLMMHKNIHVKGPSYVECSVKISVTPVFPEQAEQVELAVLKRLGDFLHPAKGGQDRTGWVLGRDLYISEINAEVEDVEGVDHVNHVALFGSVQQCTIFTSKEKKGYRTAPFDLFSGIRVATFDDQVCFLLADPVTSGTELKVLTVIGLKAEDRISLITATRKAVLENIAIGKIEALEDETLLWSVEFSAPFERPSDWKSVTGVMSSDGKVRMRIAEKRLDSSGNITGVLISGFEKTDRVCIVQENIRASELSFIPIGSAGLSTERVYVPEDCLVFSGTHDVTMTIGD